MVGAGYSPASHREVADPRFEEETMNENVNGEAKSDDEVRHTIDLVDPDWSEFDDLGTGATLVYEKADPWLADLAHPGRGRGSERVLDRVDPAELRDRLRPGRGPCRLPRRGRHGLRAGAECLMTTTTTIEACGCCACQPDEPLYVRADELLTREEVDAITALLRAAAQDRVNRDSALISCAAELNLHELSPLVVAAIAASDRRSAA